MGGQCTFHLAKVSGIIDTRQEPKKIKIKQMYECECKKCAGEVTFGTPSNGEANTETSDGGTSDSGSEGDFGFSDSGGGLSDSGSFGFSDSGSFGFSSSGSSFGGSSDFGFSSFSKRKN